MAAPSMNKPTTFVTFDIYIYIITGHIQGVCVCACKVYIHCYCDCTLYNEDELAAAAAVPVSGEIAAAARCQCVPQHFFRFCVKMFSVPCVLCPLHWLTSGDL